MTCTLKRVNGVEYEALLHVLRNRSFAPLCHGLAARLGEAEGIAQAARRSPPGSRANSSPVSNRASAIFTIT
ncbi:MAG TPA: hypothetical protein VJU59_24815 [Paraburkholderia sp.]|uniref:hypothetical protein n=1 Tax=Paraburkholderia sp. TaxID=1926495 RepID=UPI002B48B62E|nr:hypothetical protein [Paraburkholderia sp.]HKR42862.1 hypothetical protein [Paraburkholderia sp.]